MRKRFKNYLLNNNSEKGDLLLKDFFDDHKVDSFEVNIENKENLFYYLQSFVERVTL